MIDLIFQLIVALCGVGCLGMVGAVLYTAIKLAMILWKGDGDDATE